MKLAILLLCHKNPKQINLFLDALRHPNIKFFIHIDKKSNIADKLTKREDIIVLPKKDRVLTKWGSVSLVKATLNLLNAACKQDNFDYFWLCSGQDFPLKSAEEIISFLKANSQKEFLTLFNSKAYTGKNTNYDKRNALYYPKYILNNTLFARILKRLYIELTGGYNRTFLLKRKNTTGLNFYYGWQWWCLSDKMVKWILAYVKKKPEFLSFYENAIVPDESFFCTLVMNSPYAKNRTESLHYIDWSASGNNPKILTMADLPVLQKTAKLMARKFDICIDSSIFSSLQQKDINKKQKKKVLFVLPNMGGGGAERVTSSLANIWVQNSYDVSIISLINKPSFYFLDERVKLIKGKVLIDRSSLWKTYWSKLIGFPSSLILVYRIIRQQHFDMVISFIPETDILVYICKLLGLRFHHISSERGDPSRHSLLRRLVLEFIYKRTSLFICQSKKVFDHYKCIKPENKCVIPNPIDLANLPAPVSKPSLRIVSVGRLSPQKNFALLIDSFAQIVSQFPDYCLDIYGEGPLRSALQAQIDRKKKQNKVTLRGSNPQVLKEIANAALFVFPSNYEGFPNALLEALALGLPLISTDFPTGTAREIIGPENGIIVPRGDKLAMAQAMIDILSNPVKQQAMRRANIEKAKKYDLSIIMQQWEEALDKVVNNKK